MDAATSGVLGVVFGGADYDEVAIESFFDGGAGEARGLQEEFGGGGGLRGGESGRGVRFVQAGVCFGIEAAAGGGGNCDFTEQRLCFDEAVPKEGRKSVGEGSDAAGRFAAVGMRLEKGEAVDVQSGARGDVQ